MWLKRSWFPNRYNHRGIHVWFQVSSDNKPQPAAVDIDWVLCSHRQGKINISMSVSQCLRVWCGYRSQGLSPWLQTLIFKDWEGIVNITIEVWCTLWSVWRYTTTKIMVFHVMVRQRMAVHSVHLRVWICCAMLFKKHIFKVDASESKSTDTFRRAPVTVFLSRTRGIKHCE